VLLRLGSQPSAGPLSPGSARNRDGAAAGRQGPRPLESPVNRSAHRLTGSAPAKRQLGHNVLTARSSTYELGARLRPHGHVLHSPARSGHPTESAQGAPEPGASPPHPSSATSATECRTTECHGYFSLQGPPFDAVFSGPSPYPGVDAFRDEWGARRHRSRWRSVRSWMLPSGRVDRNRCRTDAALRVLRRWMARRVEAGWRPVA
jgi:hypothetical protein